MARTVFTLEVTGTKETAAALDAIAAGLTGPQMATALDAAAGRVLQSAKTFVPVWQETLKDSLDKAIPFTQGTVMQTAVGSNLVYAPAQERGTHQYFPNLANIRPWAEAHGLTAWQVAMAIVAHGVPKREYLKQAMLESKGDVLQVIGRFIEILIEPKE